MFDKPINTISLEDLKVLIDVKERENLHLEYKEKIGNSDSDKKEFLKDVSGIANSKGGLLIIGIREKDGIPVEISGVEKKIGNQKIDEWINNVLISNLELRIQYVLKLIEKDNKVVIILQILESPKKPHMVTFNNRNCYFVRHNTSVDIATHNEVKEMFEFSGKLKNKLEEFLKLRNLYNENNTDFGKNGNFEKLYFRNFDNNKKPALLYSFIPEYIEEDKVNVISEDMRNWFQENLKGFEPLPNEKLFNLKNRKIDLYGMLIPETYYDYEKNIEYYENYFEFQNNGFFEVGKSTNLFYVYPNGKIGLHLSWAVGFALLLMNFAKTFYSKINYFEEFIFQMSIINAKGAVLGGFGKPSQGKFWPEPFSIYFDNPPFCSHENFKIINKLSINEILESKPNDLLFNIASNLSHAFGVLEVKCFDESGNFVKEKMLNFSI